MTSAAFMFSYDFAFILMPISAYWRQGMSLRPVLKMKYHLPPLLRCYWCLFADCLPTRLSRELFFNHGGGLQEY